jgi:putative protease
MTKKIELLAPAGDIKRGKMALDFGADAIYLGAQQFSLRARSSNFNLKALKEIANYAKKLKKKIYLVTNIIATNTLIKGFVEFLKEVLKVCKPGAFICGDPFVVQTIKKMCPEAEIHVTTQQSVSNSKAALF